MMCTFCIEIQNKIAMIVLRYSGDAMTVKSDERLICWYQCISRWGVFTGYLKSDNAHRGYTSGKAST